MPIRKRKRRAKRKTKVKATGIREESLDFEVKKPRRRDYVGFTHLQSNFIKRMKRLAKKFGIKFNVRTIFQSKKEFGWRKTRESLEKTIRYHAGLAYTAYVDSLKDWMKDWGGDIKMPKTYRILNNPANRRSFTFAALQRAHDIMYDVKNQVTSPQAGDVEASSVLNEGLSIGREINDIFRYKTPTQRNKGNKGLEKVNPVKQTHRSKAKADKHHYKVSTKRSGKGVYQRTTTKPDR